MHNGFQVMHYQIYRFTGYLLVHLTVPDFFWAKIYPKFALCATNTPLEPSFQTCQQLSMPAAGEKTQKSRDGQRPYAPCAPHTPRLVACQHCFCNNNCANWGLIFVLFKQSQSDRLLSVLFSVITSLPWMSIPLHTQYFLAFTSLHTVILEVTFLAEVTNNHTLWHISSCIRCHNA